MYEDFYGLRDKPFALSPDPRFFYASKGHRRAMAYLEYGVQQGEGFIVITGEVGAGKTTLARSLLGGIVDRPLVAAHLVSTRLSADNLLRLVCLAFGIENPPEHKADQLRALEAFLVRIRGRGQRALLVVDEAQNLGDAAVEELRMLSNFQGEEGGPLLQSFLLGQPEFRRLMRSENMQQLRQRVIATYHLGPMDEEDTRAYIEHRLREVGWADDPSFSEGAWQRIYDYTRGIPRRINTLCDRLLLMGYLEECHEFSVREVQSVIDEVEADLGEATSDQESAPVAGQGEANGNGAGVEVATLDQRLQRLERYLGFTYRQVQQGLAVHREDQQRLDQRLERMERYLVSNYRLARQIGSTVKRMLGVRNETD
ncbi:MULTISPECIES: XrtA/PEP-CTERM system-associated ATPase [Halorhodospira]|uniref:XrtA/PEP-CTERM system-associated ATPase n=1 Tax=Halorhodospira TaxID=85108 RepID=UPI001EE7FB55|nr:MULTISPECIES: XrtA/PEP-CTERM system-associated ATPase [Halorhodospira]MCG5528463.1 XrtA-associated ATPase [Halorhodospira halophila]MCG5544425.1 XrtA-associated ATPase [Halorhodospira sp. 9628]